MARLLQDEQEAKRFEELNQKERTKTLECVMKVMNRQLDQIKSSVKDLDKMHQDYVKDLNEFEVDHQRKENGLFKEYHEARVKRLKLMIEEGGFSFEEGEAMISKINLDEITDEELQAHAELKEFAEAIKKRQQKFQLTDVAQAVVDNKILINEIDDLLGQRHTADDGRKYSQIPNSISVPSLSYDVSQSTLTALVNNTSRSLLGDPEGSLDDVAINRLYYELVDPTKPTKQPKKQATTKALSKKKKFEPKPHQAGYIPKKAMTITEVGKKAKSRLFDYKEEHDSIQSAKNI